MTVLHKRQYSAKPYDLKFRERAALASVREVNS